MNCLRILTRLHQSSIFKISSLRHISQHTMNFEDNQQRWRELDGVSKRYQLVYKGPMESILKVATTYLTVTTATMGLSSVYYGAFVFDVTKMNSPVFLGNDIILANNVSECMIYIGAFIMLHVTVRVLLSKYVLRLYEADDKYIAIFPGHIYNQISKHEFDLKDVKKLKPTLIPTWGEARYGLGNKHGILLPNYFKTPEHYNKLTYQTKSKRLHDDDDD